MIIESLAGKPNKEEIREAFRDVFASPKGKIALRHLASITGVDGVIFHPDALTLAFREGQRRVALEIITLALVDLPDLLLNTTPEEENTDE